MLRPSFITKKNALDIHLTRYPQKNRGTVYRAPIVIVFSFATGIQSGAIP